MKRVSTPSKDTLKVPCDVCGMQTEAGPHRYTGKVLRGYQIWACEICRSSNFDGWGPIREPTLMKILRDKGIDPPARNAKGWLPLEFSQ